MARALPAKCTLTRQEFPPLPTVLIPQFHLSTLQQATSCCTLPLAVNPSHDGAIQQRCCIIYQSATPTTHQNIQVWTTQVLMQNSNASHANTCLSPPHIQDCNTMCHLNNDYEQCIHHSKLVVTTNPNIISNVSLFWAYATHGVH